jgi:hypothetical protein
VRSFSRSNDFPHRLLWTVDEGAEGAFGQVRDAELGPPMSRGVEELMATLAATSEED